MEAWDPSDLWMVGWSVLTSKACAQGVMVVSIDAASGFKEGVTAIVEFCNLFIWEGTSGKPDTMQK